jgi:hypothetical protein
LLGLKPRCAACGLDYAFADAGDGPAVFVILIVGFIVIGSVLWLEVNYSPADLAAHPAVRTADHHPVAGGAALVQGHPDRHAVSPQCQRRTPVP